MKTYLKWIVISLLSVLTFLALLSLTQLGGSFDDNRTSLQQDLSNVVDQQRGAHVFGRLDSANVQQFKKNNIDWITLVPFCSQESHDSPELRHRQKDSMDLVRSNMRWVEQIQVAHNAGMKVFIKPHIWLHTESTDKWRSDIYPANDADWQTWQESYRDYILRYARVAEEGQAEMFCIGTELTRLSLEKPKYWRNLIQEVRTIYSGKITYAANWYQEYENLTFWDELDYIGIQAYFPLTSNENPSLAQISKGWSKHISVIEKVSKRYKRKVLFTEMGYKSTRDSAIKPWVWIDYSNIKKEQESQETQARCYQAFFDAVWPQNWMAGVHLWQMRSDHIKGELGSNLDFTPQGKMAEGVIKAGFKD